MGIPLCNYCGEEKISEAVSYCDTCEKELDCLRLCGCGDPVSGLQVVCNFLEVFEKGEMQHSHDDLDRLPAEDPVGAANLILGLLDSADLIEHGTTIYYSWLTEKGKKVLEHLKKIKEFQEKNK